MARQFSGRSHTQRPNSSCVWIEKKKKKEKKKSRNKNLTSFNGRRVFNCSKQEEEENNKKTAHAAAAVVDDGTSRTSICFSFLPFDL